ncbi:protein FAM149B1 [Aplochiton taeniatus]
MISRYNRRPVSHNLEIRGLSRSSLDQHPLPEEVDDHPVPQRFLHDLQETVSTYTSSETSAESGQSDCPTVTTGDGARSWSGIHSYTGTGISTERSSVFSWGYDEFDKAASRHVQKMFEEIDAELYEGRGGGAQLKGGGAQLRGGGTQLRGLQEECQQWASRFPHLRILGSQLVCPGDEGFQWYSTSGESSPTSSRTPPVTKETGPRPPDRHRDSSSTELCVQGRRALLSRPCPGDPDGPSGGPSGPQAYDMPRVLEAEGLVEEYLAFDSRDLDDEWEREVAETGRRRNFLPPVSPYRCRRQAVLDFLFDDVWRETVGWIEELVRRHWEGCVSDDERTPVNFSPAQPDLQNPFTVLSTHPTTTLPRLGQNKVTQLTSNLQPQTTKSKGPKHKSRRKSKKQKKPSTPSRVPVGVAGPAVTHPNLNDIIVIHGIPLQQRNLGLLERTQDTVDERPPHRPGSSVAPSSKPRPRRTLEQSSSSLTRPPQSARRRNPPPRTLLPLVPSLTQSSAAGSMDEVIRGTRLPTASDRLTSPPMPLGRNTLLPPIGSGEPESSTHSGQQARNTQRQRGCSSRAHSAVTEEACGLLPRDRHHLLDIFSRPNTTHTYRSDTPYRRSFTVLDNIVQGRTGRASVATDSLGIGVTGISLGISSSSFLDSFSHHPLGHSPIEDEEEPDAKAPLSAVQVPVLLPPRSYMRGGNSSRGNRPGV